MDDKDDRARLQAGCPGECAIYNVIDIAKFNEVISTTYRTENCITAVVTIDLRIICKIGIDVLARESAIVRMAFEIGPRPRKIQFGKQACAFPLQVIEKRRQSLAQNRVPIQSRQCDIASTLKEEMPKMMVEQRRRQLIGRDIVENDHTHPATDVRSDHVRKDRAFDVSYNADRYGLAWMKVGGRGYGPQGGTLLRHRVGGRQSAREICK